MGRSIEKVAVLGAGVMGATLAAHMANAGLHAVLLDIVPPEGSGIDGDPSTPAYRNAFSDGGLKRAVKARPNAFYKKEGARRIATGNLEDHLEMLRDTDWILEVVVEQMEIKRALFEKIQPFLKETAILSSNTSGLSINEMAEGLDESVRGRFLGTHFFNPPRYMRLLEMIPSQYTDPEVLAFVSTFGENVLGKGIVMAKDTPNFIANRIGVYSMMSAIHAMLKGNYTIEEVDTLTGPIIGRPKSASFRTADLVGLDTFLHVAKNVYDRAEDDECRESFVPPDFMEKMAKEGYLGDKTRQGFYKKEKKDGKKEILALDYNSLEYKPRQKASFPSIELARNIDDPGERVKTLLKGKDRASQYLWDILSDMLIYSAHRLGEISDDIINIDNAMKWGFNWELGPFELWDALGVEKSVERMEKEGKTVPDVVKQVLTTPEKRFYSEDESFKKFYFNLGGAHEALPIRSETTDLTLLKKTGAVVKENAGASLIDMGDGVLCLEFHSKMNAIGQDTIQMLNAAVKEVEEHHEALVIGNEGQNFSVGANLMLLLMEAQEGNWEEIDFVVRAFQRANMALKYCKRPVVAAPFGLTLAGGTEICLGSGHMNVSAETYMGLVEVGVGLIPAGAGTKELLFRNYEGMPFIDGVDLFPYVRATFETIGMGKVSMSAEEGRDYKFLRSTDAITLNPEKLLQRAKGMALGLAKQGYRPPDATIEVPAAGESALATFKTHLYNMEEAKYISEYDRYLGGELARVICGGALPAGTQVGEQYYLDLEREVFLRLCGQKKTQERIQYMLKKGKPLRN